MSDVVIIAERLGKSYTIDHRQSTPYATLRDTLVDLFRGLGRRSSRTAQEEFWALRELNFTVQAGDRLAIIGRNGAGKSTLLKVLSRITAPTTGRVTLRGRVASLLEVGTGFHPELSGRDNIFLNGAILGMKKREIAAKFDEIVAFSEIEKFLDTPVKRYSSGMYVRLAFAVAAHLDPEILIVDEVLAVGDAKFQKKCLGKMEDVSKQQGRTVLFVSHNMGAVKSLCNKAILLEHGQKVAEGDTETVANRYAVSATDALGFKALAIAELGATLRNITLNAAAEGAIVPGKSLTIDLEIECERELRDIGIQLMISNDDTRGTVFASNTKVTKNIDVKLTRGTNRLSLIIDRFNLCSGPYWLGFAIDTPFIRYYFHEPTLLAFEVTDTVIEPNLVPTLPAYGRVYLDHRWVAPT